MNIVLLLGLLLLLALFATRLTRLMHLPNVTAFLVIGIIVAIICTVIDTTGFKCSDGFSLSQNLNRLNSFISDVALGFIALSIGQEFKISKLKSLGKRIVIITLFQSLAAVLFVDVALLIACKLFNLNSSVALCLGAIATATAPAATLMVIHQYKAHGPLVDTLLPVVALDDAVGLIVFSISVAISKVIVSGVEVTFTTLVLLPLIEIFGSLLIGFLFGLLMHLVIHLFKSRNNHVIVIIAFTLLGVGACQALNLIKISGETLEFSALLTCMMTGATYVNLAKGDDANGVLTRDFDLIDRWEQFLLTLFFVLSGCHLVTSGYTIITNDSGVSFVIVLVIFGIYLIMRSSGKYFGALVGCKVTKCEKNITKYLGLTLLPQAGVAIGMANQISGMVSFEIDNIGNIIVTVVLLATLIYELFGPLITKKALEKSGEIDPENLK